jgi:cell wall-associated NlpC family hydrolase
MLLSAALVSTAVLTTSSATAAPKPTAGQVQRKVEQLHHDAEKAAEAYNDTREELKSIDVRLKAADTKLNRQRAQLAQSRVKLGQLAAETYRQGELSVLNLVLGDDPDSALAQAGYLPSLSARQASSTKRLTDGERKLLATRTEIKKQQAKAQAGQAKLRKSKDDVTRRLRAVEAQLNSLSASERASVTQAERNRDSVNLPAGTGGGKTLCNGKAVQAPSAAAKAALTFACAQLGDSYQWAADGMTRWDCSGLTMKSYAAAGISLPHSSRLQAGFGTRVSTSQMLPGDLVFFHSPISHVSLYLGGGMMVTAPQTGDVVKVAKFFSSPVAAVRLG